MSRPACNAAALLVAPLLCIAALTTCSRTEGKIAPTPAAAPRVTFFATFKYYCIDAGTRFDAIAALLEREGMTATGTRGKGASQAIDFALPDNTKLSLTRDGRCELRRPGGDWGVMVREYAAWLKTVGAMEENIFQEGDAAWTHGKQLEYAHVVDVSPTESLRLLAGEERMSNNETMQLRLARRVVPRTAHVDDSPQGILLRAFREICIAPGGDRVLVDAALARWHAAPVEPTSDLPEGERNLALPQLWTMAATLMPDGCAVASGEADGSETRDVVAAWMATEARSKRNPTIAMSFPEAVHHAAYEIPRPYGVDVVELVELHPGTDSRRLMLVVSRISSSPRSTHDAMSSRQRPTP